VTSSDWARLGLGLLVGSAALIDVTARRIPNALNLIVAISGVAAVLVFAPGEGWSHALHFLIALAIGAGLFAIRVIGGGDAKLYAAVALWFPLQLAIPLGAAISLAGVVLLLIYWAVKVFSSTSGENSRRKIAAHTGLPYGAAIAVGTILIAFSFQSYGVRT